MTNTEDGLPKFFDFHVIVNKVAGHSPDEYVVFVADAPTERHLIEMGSFRLTESDKDLWIPEQQSFLRLGRTSQYRQFVLSTRGGGELTEDQVGEGLFSLLFPKLSNSRLILHASCGAAPQPNWLRVKLELHPDLACLPWELLRCPDTDLEAASINSTNLAVVRYFGKQTRRTVGQSSGKAPTVVLVEATPEGVGGVNVALSIRAEVDRIRDTLQPRYECQVIRGKNTFGQLVDVMRRLGADGATVAGVHFAGHGDVDEAGGSFIGVGPEGDPDPISAPRLDQALRPAANIEWAVLNSCWSAAAPVGRSLAGLATSLVVKSRIPTVLAYQRPVNNENAERLADRFYRDGLMKGHPIEEVLRLVRLEFNRTESLVILQRSMDGQSMILAGAPEAKAAPMRSASPRRDSETPPPTPVNPPAAPTPQGAHAPNDRPFVTVPAGPFRRGLSTTQVGALIEQFRRSALPMDFDSFRQSLLDSPASTVQMPAFQIGRTPVTNAQFKKFVDKSGWQTDAERSGESENWRTAFNSSEQADHPVVFVSYNDAEAYCKWAGARLPMPDEWEKAYRGENGNLYPWGDEFDVEKCNTAENVALTGTTSSVERFAAFASPYGCLDMIGNVEEWTNGTGAGGRKIVRGGSFQMTCQVYGLPVLHRLALPTSSFFDTGFRCVKLDGN